MSTKRDERTGSVGIVSSYTGDVGRTGWVGCALIVFGIGGLAGGLNAERPPLGDPVTLTLPELARAATLSLGLVASVFGLVLVVIRQAESIRWGRGLALFLLLAGLVYVCVQGPEIAALVWRKDRAWAGAVHDGVNGALLAMTLVWQVRAFLMRGARTGEASSPL